MKLLALLIFTILILSDSLYAASFDCTKARSAHERHICSNIDLNVTDSQLGEAYRAAVRSFPLKGFVQATERRFLLWYQFCDGQSGPSCKSLLLERIAILEGMANPIAVYANYNPLEIFNPESGVFWIALTGKSPMLHYFGSAMPDMITQASFPEGFVCDDALPLVKALSGYTATDNDDETIVTDKKITASIMCSPRNRMGGDYARVH